MQIDLSNATTEKLAGQATAAGFSSVEQYVTEFVHILAERANVDEVFVPLIDKELAESLAMIDRGMEQIQSVFGLTVDEARCRSLASLGNRC
jgi:hypothetical protein